MYFVDLLEYDRAQEQSPDGKPQWVTVLKDDATDSDIPDIMMLTSDVALLMVRKKPSVGLKRDSAGILPRLPFIHGKGWPPRTALTNDPTY